jgi:hypothetical protein
MMRKKRKYTGCCQGLEEGGNGMILFNRHRVSVLHPEKTSADGQG